MLDINSRNNFRFNGLDYRLFQLYIDENKRFEALPEYPSKYIEIKKERTLEQNNVLQNQLCNLPKEVTKEQSKSIDKLNELGKTFQVQHEEEKALCKKLEKLNEIKHTIESDEDAKKIVTLIHSPIRDFIKDHYSSISNLRRKYLNNRKTLRENIKIKEKKAYNSKYNSVEEIVCLNNLESSELQRLLKFFEEGALKYPRLMHVVLEWPLCATMPPPPKELSDYCEQEEYEYMLRRLKVPYFLDSCFSTPETQSTAWLLYPKNESWSKESGFNLFHQLWYDINSEFNCNWEILLHSYGIMTSNSNNHHLWYDGWDGLFDDDYVTFDNYGWENGFYHCYYITNVFYESVRLCKHLLSICNRNSSETEKLKQYLSILDTTKELSVVEQKKLKTPFEAIIDQKEKIIAKYKKIQEQYNSEYENMSKLKGFPNNLSPEDDKKLMGFEDRKSKREVEFAIEFAPDTIKKSKNRTELAEQLCKEIAYSEVILTNDNIPENDKDIESFLGQVKVFAKQMAVSFSIDVNFPAETNKEYLISLIHKCLKQNTNNKPVKLPVQIVESDNPNGPWTEVPAEAIKTTVRSLDEARIENPVLQWFIPVDLQTELYDPAMKVNTGLSSIQLATIRKRFGEHCTLDDIRVWLAERNLKITDFGWPTIVKMVERDVNDYNSESLKLRQFEGFKGYIGSKEIVNKYNIPRTTLQAWQERDCPETKTDPQTNENYYPESWLRSQLKNYKPRKKHK